MDPSIITKEIKQLNLLKDFLQVLPELKHKRNKIQLSNFNSQLSELLPIYNRQLNKAQKIFESLYKQNKRLLSPTTFEVMRRHKLEETHSNVIAYLLAKDKGYELLKGILTHLDRKKNSKIPNFNRRSFKVDREKVIKGKRIDIWVESNNFLVVIENKFNARLHMVDEEHTQAEFYRDEIRKLYKNPIFILLDYKGTEFCEDYYSMNYKDLLLVLLKAKRHFSKDFVYEDYVSLLLRLLSKINNISKVGVGKVEYLSNINNINEVLLNGTKEHYT